ncbi:hypothetical protein ART_2965 [Arthrobacter sp. PAMC 25486]|uniref:hypothetical protein n=1 Tax=Arthrobacter sp. PAMC 25486 TaxID=1494608 RepID=UPI000535D101|nr:hypothetical protein [Arthrobacter sp. PAMC 25486]AIY02564.1 hypothetical protein ART_2965 [Arthrobacter sp. PAMC 25486]
MSKRNKGNADRRAAGSELLDSGYFRQRMALALLVPLSIALSVLYLASGTFAVDWLIDNVAAMQWLDGWFGLAAGDLVASLVLYIPVVSYLSLAGIVLNLAMGRVYLRGGGTKGYNAREKLVIVAVFMTLISVLWAWISWDERNAASFAALVANVLLLLLSAVPPGLALAGRTPGKHFKDRQMFAVIAVLTVSWAAGIFWGLA